MKFAILGNNKVEATKGAKGTCQFCGSELIAKCGEINIDHWAHTRVRNCDPWWENETEWHRKWKARFPEEWQEVILENEDEKHIADIKKPNGIVIEFQNSSISPSTIRIREDFYGEMIWVVNAERFKGNLKIRSEVSSQLRSIDRDISYELKLLEESYAHDLKSIDEAIKKNEKETNERFTNIRYNKKIVENLKQVLNDNEMFVASVVEKWCNGESYWDAEANDIIYSVKPETKTVFQEITKEIEKMKGERKSNEDRLSYLLSLENILVDDKQFKIARYNQIPSASFKNVRAITKASRKTLFPETAKFDSEAEFKRFENSKDHFDFAIDPTNIIALYKQRIEEAQVSIDSLEKRLVFQKEEITREIVQKLHSKIHQVETGIEKLNCEWDELIKQSSRLVERQAKILNLRDKEIGDSKSKIEKKRNEKRFKIMREKKGFYKFDWKYERKSWQAAQSTIYFDTGESYLFKLIKDGLLRKFDIQDFLQQHAAFILGT